MTKCLFCDKEIKDLMRSYGSSYVCADYHACFIGLIKGVYDPYLNGRVIWHDDRIDKTLVDDKLVRILLDFQARIRD